VALQGKIADLILDALPASYRARLFRRLARKLDVPSFSVQGDLGNFEGDAKDSVVHHYYMENRNWAEGLQSLLSRIFRSETGTYFDIGANIGLTLIPMARHPRVRCFGFEAVPATFKLLQRNLLCNQIGDNATVFNLAVFDRKTSLEMELSDINMGDHRVRGAGNLNAYAESTRKTIQVPAERLDSVMEQSNWQPCSPNFMKVDVQGAEVRVLRGGVNTLAALDYLYIEYWPYGMLRMGDRAEDFLDAVKQFQFGMIFDDTRPVGELTLNPIEGVLRELRKIPSDGSTTEHRDLLLSRAPKI
jgi:FkbM family methyltransferase